MTRSRYWAIYLALGLAALLAPRWSQAMAGVAAEPMPARFIEIGTTHRPATALAVAPPFAYVGVGDRFVIVDVSDPRRPRDVAQSRAWSGLADDMAVTATHAFVSAGYDGLLALDIREPSRPRVTGRLAMTASRLALGDGLLYVMDTSYCLAVVDIRAPANPTRLGTWCTDDWRAIVDFAVAGHHAFVIHRLRGGDEQLAVVDLSDPGAPRLVAGSREVGGAQSLAVDGGYAYVSVQSGQPGLAVLDVRDPRDPRPLGFAGFRQLDGAQPTRVLVRDGTAYVGGRDAVVAVDVRAPAAPAVLGAAPHGAITLHALAYGDGQLLAATDLGLVAMTASALPGPRQVAMLQDLHPWADVAAGGGEVFVLDGGVSGAISRWDVRDPRQPLLTDADMMCCDVRSIALHAPYLYVVDSIGLLVLDVDAPPDRREVGRVRLEPAPYLSRIAIEDGRAYVAASQNRLWVIDVRDPTAPRLEGSTAIDESVRALSVGAGRAWVATLEGLRVFDVREPSAPRRLPSMLIPVEDARDVAVVGTVAYIADLVDGLVVWDIADPDQPRRLAALGEVPAACVVVQGPRAYVCDWAAAVAILDVTEPAAPHVIASTGIIGGAAYRMAVSEGMAYLVDEAFGLIQVDLAEPPAGGAVTGRARWNVPPGVLGIVDHRLFVASGSSLASTDVRAPEQMRRSTVAAGAARLGDPGDMVVTGGYAYVVHAGKGLAVFDVRDDEQPRWAGALAVPVAAAIAVAGGHAYVPAQGGGLLIVDVSDPSRPQTLHTLLSPTRFEALAVDSGRLYAIAVDSGQTRRHLVVFDLADPSRPAELGRTEIDAQRVIDLAVADGLAVVALAGAGVAVIDVSAPRQPRLLAVHPTRALAESLCLVDDHVYVVGAGGIEAVDLAQPDRPRTVAFGLGTFTSVQADGGTAFASGRNWVSILWRGEGVVYLPRLAR